MVDLAHQVGLPVPVLEETASLFREAKDKGWTDEELTVVSRIARGRKTEA